MRTSVFPQRVCKRLILKRKWWNWQTHHLEGVAPKGMGVQVPPCAPNVSISARPLSQNQKLNRAAARTEHCCNDHFDHIDSRYCLLLSDCSGVAAKRQERRLGCGVRRSGQPDGFRPARRGIGSFPCNHLVRDHFHVHLDYAVDFCGATKRSYLGIFRSKTGANEVTARGSCTFRAANCSAKPGAKAIISEW
jgi:hypothetical protein